MVLSPQRRDVEKDPAYINIAGEYLTIRFLRMLDTGYAYLRTSRVLDLGFLSVIRARHT